MKIAIGVCGIGFGHSSRQLQIARRLTEMGHEVRILTFGSGYDYFRKTEFKDVLQRIFVPWVECDARGLRRWTTIRKNLRGGLRGLARNRRTFAELRALGFRPDVCVADYDPVTWWLARRSKAPLVTIDHQSSYLGYRLESLSNTLSPQEERSRLALFCPSAAKRIAISFFRIKAPPDANYRVRLMPPIIRRDVMDLATSDRTVDDRLVLVYFSAYPKIDSFVDLEETVRTLSALAPWRFKIYSGDVTEARTAARNVELSPTLADAFLADMGKASALICTAGFTLLSEAMIMGLPVLAVPLANYDQHLCAHVIADLGVGAAVDSERSLSEENVTDFLSRLEEFRLRIAETDQLLRAPTDEVLRQICHEIVTA
jgi:uncharacterized protein (TIGR00661 family)